MKIYTATQLKAMAFEANVQIQMLQQKRAMIFKELAERNELITGVDITPNDEGTTNEV